MISEVSKSGDIWSFLILQTWLSLKFPTWRLFKLISGFLSLLILDTWASYFPRLWSFQTWRPFIVSCSPKPCEQFVGGWVGSERFGLSSVASRWTALSIIRSSWVRPSWVKSSKVRKSWMLSSLVRLTWVKLILVRSTWVPSSYIRSTWVTVSYIKSRLMTSRSVELSSVMSIST